eukprot:TRINITY_DN10679_c0_g1_i2.p1 TRINITY_DN10679_c0_g1~~TRINITY_DN10679_c0_g1_i2.p1  ORF type:complete len:508 (+),score=79.87 TRINITY_DN10679_c0_g1_i2:121-1644(+)
MGKLAGSVRKISFVQGSTCTLLPAQSQDGAAYPSTVDENTVDEKCQVLEPVLKRIFAHARSPEVLATFVAAELHGRSIRKGEAICEGGEPAESMLVLTSGRAELHSKEAGMVGSLGPGAFVGEAVLLGLLSFRTATLLATSSCEIVEISFKLLSKPKYRIAREALAKLAAARREQFDAGLPMRALPLGIAEGDLCAAAVAMQAQRLLFPAGAIWETLPDTDPGGPHFGVLATGEANVELSNKGRWVARLQAGSFVPEGLLSELGAVVRALRACTAYRVQQADFLSITGATPACRQWYERCRFLERQVCADLLLRIQGAASVQEWAEDATRPQTAPSRLRAEAPRVHQNPALKDPPVFPVSCPADVATPQKSHHNLWRRTVAEALGQEIAKTCEHTDVSESGRRPARPSRARSASCTNSKEQPKSLAGSRASSKSEKSITGSRVSVANSDCSLPMCRVRTKQMPRARACTRMGGTRVFVEGLPGDLSHSLTLLSKPKVETKPAEGKKT